MIGCLDASEEVENEGNSFAILLCQAVTVIGSNDYLNLSLEASKPRTLYLN